MIRIHRRLEYALLALQRMLDVGATASSGRLVTARELCSVHPMPFDVVAKVLQKLVQHGLVGSEQGAYGGYRLAVDIAEMTLHDLSEVVVGPIRFATCMHDSAECQLTPSCTVISPVVSLAKRVERLYREVTVAELLASHEDEERTIRARFAHRKVERERVAGPGGSAPAMPAAD